MNLTNRPITPKQQEIIGELNLIDYLTCVIDLHVHKCELNDDMITQLTKLRSKLDTKRIAELEHISLNCLDGTEVRCYLSMIMGAVIRSKRYVTDQ
jgi:hypothetical protein